MGIGSTVVLDACVLYPALLRNVLLQLATTGLFRARWSMHIHDEWTRRVQADRPDITSDQLDRYRRLMEAAVPDGIVRGHDSLVRQLSLPDPGDRHVLAAAIRCRAEFIVTANLRDFPDELLVPHGTRAVHPDDFLLQLFDTSPEAVCVGLKTMRARFRNPSLTAGEVLDRLTTHGLIKVAGRLREFEHAL